MGSKSKSSKALRKTGPFKLRDLQDGSSIALDLWAMTDPAQCYEANACDVLTEARELILVFGQNPPGRSKPLTAISIGLPLDDVPDQIDAFSDIRLRLERQKFTRSEEEERHLDRDDLETLTQQTYTRFSAQYIRAVSSDSVAVLDFYKRPVITLAKIEARPNEVLEFAPVLRVSCPALILNLMLRLVDEALKEASQ